MRKSTKVVLPVLVGMLIAFSQPAQAEQVCQVTDPTGTPLNIRSSPNGKIVRTLRNGTEVYIHEMTSDRKGRAWALVGSYQSGSYKTWGWVFREFLSCYNR